MIKRIVFIALGFSAVLFANLSKEGGIVTDDSSGLQWQDNTVQVKLTWFDAIIYCENLTLDEQTNWRLPNINELTSIVDDTKSSPSIDTSVFENTSQDIYWSSTTMAGNPDSAWYIDFSSIGGNVYHNPIKNNLAYVRCVKTKE